MTAPPSPLGARRGRRRSRAEEDRAHPARRSGAPGRGRRRRLPSGLDATEIAAYSTGALRSATSRSWTRRSSSSSRSRTGRSSIGLGVAANTLHDAILSSAQLQRRTGNEQTQLLAPASLRVRVRRRHRSVLARAVCARAWTVRAVRNRTYCDSLLARRLLAAPPAARQVRLDHARRLRATAVLGLSCRTCTVPVPAPPRQRRRADPPGAARDSLSLLTIDLPADDGDDPVGASFMATPWSTDRRDGSGKLLDLPSQLGVDMSLRATASAACLDSPGHRQVAPLQPRRMAVNLTAHARSPSATARRSCDQVLHRGGERCASRQRFRLQPAGSTRRT
jgi:hypothetical protein